LALNQQQAVFVDAGIKNGIAQIGAVLVSVDEHGIRTKAESYFAEAKGIHEAEALAVVLGASLTTRGDCPIYCDNDTVTNFVPVELKKRVKWIPRHKNKAADKIANMRS
jgi:hypothetical protein